MRRDAATQAQVDAAAPKASTWLSANAGSGKTRVLTDRVARLLLENVDPQHILCLTYTKAAASEMQNRLFSRLGRWAMMGDQLLKEDLKNLGFERKITHEELAHARTLFARAIETPGGLKIQTIHSFCGSILRRFPLEAGVSPQFRELVERDITALQESVLDEMVEDGLNDVLRGILSQLSTQDDVLKFLAHIYQKRHAFLTQNDALSGGVERALGIPEDLSENDIYARAYRGGSKALVDDICEGFKNQSATYIKFAKNLTTIDFNTPTREGFEGLFAWFTDSKGSSKSGKFPQSNHAKALEAAESFLEELHVWMDHVVEAEDMLRALGVARRTKALYRFAPIFLERYEAKKVALGVLDFDDLIRKTYDLLRDPLVAQWVLFRLDGGIDHVLIDEAQDTSPQQWAVIERMTQEFTAGEGARTGQERTIFVVGDKKQSIYSFQGADPEAFDQMKAHFSQGLEASQKHLQDQSLAYSFRSSQAILRVVDSCFRAEYAKGLDREVFHHTFKSNMPGRVDLWPVMEDQGKLEDVDWTQPIDQLPNTDPSVQLANQIAQSITHMIAHETVPCEIGHSGEYQRRKITEGDILILVRGRKKALFSEILRACKSQGLKVAGADRLILTQELAVKDLMALLSFLALPEDDLSLASALKSPLFGWGEQDLFSLAHYRPKQGYLWQALRKSTAHQDTLAVLNELRRLSDFTRPYELLDCILTRFDGRKNLLARLGLEAEESIDALLQESLQYEQEQVPSLTGFVSWMSNSDIEIKRSVDAQGDAIRVMTVHGAKGLEAPIVFLPETSDRKNEIKDHLVVADNLTLWRPSSQEKRPVCVNELCEGLLEKQEHERLRLLYVAMTRAEKWLIVAAAGKVGEGSWYDVVQKGMQHAGAYDVEMNGLGMQRVCAHEWDGLPVADEKITGAPAIPELELQELTSFKRPRPVTPSLLAGEKVIAEGAGEICESAALAALNPALRGNYMHLLLEHLVNIDPSQQREQGMKILAMQGFQDVAVSYQLIEMCLRVLHNSELSHIFSCLQDEEDGLNEVAVSAHLPNGPRLNGVIDRLIVGKNTVKIIDYKSNTRVPTLEDEIPRGLLAQLGAYRHAIELIYPNHRVETYILWIQSATLMNVSAHAVKSALLWALNHEEPLDQ